ncbi:cation efflux protein [Hesseltinella vesiculosa]|uniref:Cation efflux protein n=1 Tax=Hesseltinella vesiculosa TaxID=101127 RepID=A0A1X2GAC3_9FUNG|nr:cation efflux protein [Hesseltinella vesiculosa]
MMVIYVTFFIAELGVGYYTSSLALIADSFHMLNDLISLMVALWAIRLANRPVSDNSKYTYGWQRAEILGALLNGVFLLALCVAIVLQSVERFIRLEQMTNPDIVVIVAGAGLVSNIFGMFLFHDHSHHHHGHGHSKDDHDIEQHTHEGGGGHMNMKGIFLHVLGDALGNIGVIAAALFIWFAPYDWRYYADPFISLLIAIVIFTTAVPLVRQTSNILLQGVPASINLVDLRDSLLKIPGINSVHELHIWQLSDTKIVASLHVLIEHGYDYMDLSAKLRKTLHSFGVHSATIQPEFLDQKETLNDLASDSLSTSLQAIPAQQPPVDSSCLLHCIEDESCYENACCPPPYTQPLHPSSLRSNASLATPPVPSST